MFCISSESGTHHPLTLPRRSRTFKSRLETAYQNPTRYSVSVARQTHSITLTFSAEGSEVLSVDIVPAYASGRNEFGEDEYFVPEIAMKSRGDRRRIIAEVSRGGASHGMDQIRSTRLYRRRHAYQRSEWRFRRALKLVKGWRASCKDANANFPLKSFHLEQIITRDFQRDPKLELFDAVFSFFCDLPAHIARSQIPDRADPGKNIDAYIASLSNAEKEWITQARDHFLINLEETDGNVGKLIEAGRSKRASATETYLFDQRIPMLVEETFFISGRVLARTGGFREYFLDATGRIEVDRQIEFRLRTQVPSANLYKWKVKNDNGSVSPRGEITDRRTLRDPEEMKYNGNHYVECFAIRDGICIGRARQNVVLDWPLNR